MKTVDLNTLAAEDFELAAKYAKSGQVGMACHHAELGIEAYKRSAMEQPEAASAATEVE